MSYHEDLRYSMPNIYWNSLQLKHEGSLHELEKEILIDIKCELQAYIAGSFKPGREVHTMEVIRALIKIAKAQK